MKMQAKTLRSQTTETRPKRVLVSTYIGVTAARETFSGIVARINGNHPSWIFDYEFDRDKAFGMLKANRDRYDGMIAENPASAEELAALAALDVPIVFTKNVTDGRLDARRISYVLPDDEEIGREGFRHLSALGKFESWVFAPDRHNRRFSRLRGAGFAEALLRRFPNLNPVTLPWPGIEAEAGSAGGGEGGGSREAALETLKSLPRPLAILAVNDNMALNVLSLCRLAGIAVPGQAMVLGIDNDTMVCLNAKPTLSSIQPDHFVLGERAVDELARLMSGRPGRTMTIRLPIRAVAVRESTRFLPPAKHLVRQALKFIGENADNALSVAEVAAHLHVSRPLLDLRFRQLHGGSVGKAIAAARLEEVRRRLSGTRTSATEIAVNCGFGSVSALSRFFRRETGVPLSSWRKR